MVLLQFSQLIFFPPDKINELKLAAVAQISIYTYKFILGTKSNERLKGTLKILSCIYKTGLRSWKKKSL